MRRNRALLFFALLSFVLSACGGGGGGGAGSPALPQSPSAPGGGTQQQQQVQQQNSVAAANAAGAPVEDVSNFENGFQNPVTLQSAGRRLMDGTPTPGASGSPAPGPSPIALPTPPPNGTCIPNFFALPGASGEIPYLGFEYWKPDKAGDANSVEYMFFYDTGCTHIAKDTVRIINSVTGTGSVKTQTQTVTTTEYDKGSSTPSRVSAETNTITGQFDSEGYPDLKAGFARSSQRTLTVGGTLVASNGNEYIVAPSTTTSHTMCGDSAGFNADRLESTSQIHGWQNLVANASRTVNADGSVTYTNSSSGSVFAATPPATFTVNKGTLNGACPIATPAFTLSGGSVVSSYSIPSMSATFNHGALINLTVTNETLANGYTLNIVTNAGVAPTSPGFITGTITNAGATVATFSVDQNGDGTLTVASTGTVYTLTHWHVTKDNSGSPSPSPTGSHSPEPTHSPSPVPNTSPSPTHS